MKQRNENRFFFFLFFFTLFFIFVTGEETSAQRRARLNQTRITETLEKGGKKKK
jgi:hypothetical protein